MKKKKELHSLRGFQRIEEDMRFLLIHAYLLGRIDALRGEDMTETLLKKLRKEEK